MSAAVQAAQPFTHWSRSMDDGALSLWIEQEGRVIERVSIDVCELPSRPDLLARLGDRTRARMLWEAREVAKGNVSLDPAFTGFDASPVGALQ